MSGLFSMISSLELTQGAYFPAKGMRSIVTSLYKLAVEEKVDFMFGKNAQLTPNADGHFSLKGTNIRATQIISAIDHLTFHEHVLPNDKMHARYSPLERSSSGLVFYWGVSTTIPDLTVHNIFFGDNYQREFQSIFNDKLNYKAPTVYVHVSSLVNSKDAPDNSMNLFVMINTSAHDAPNEEYRRGMKKYVEYIFLKKFGVSLNEHRVVDEYWDNDSIQERSGSFTGALYGPASNSISAVLRRHPNKLNNTPNVFFCGGTVHPGGGIPLVLRSAKIVADLI